MTRMDHDIHAIEAIARGDHGDPFAFLGMHDGGKSGLIVRTFLPFAKAVTVVEASDGKAIADLKRVHSSGVFVGRMGTADQAFSLPLPYRDRAGRRDRIGRRLSLLVLHG